MTDPEDLIRWTPGGSRESLAGFIEEDLAATLRPRFDSTERVRGYDIILFSSGKQDHSYWVHTQGEGMRLAELIYRGRATRRTEAQ